MGSAKPHGKTLRANLCEVERGVFYATYPDGGAVTEMGELIIFQVGTCAAEAKQRIEHRAVALGYDTVIWTETIVVPVFAAQALDKPTATYTGRRGA